MSQPVSPPPASSWWSKERHQDRRGILLARAKIVSAIRAWFADQGFIEAEPGALTVSPGAEVHVSAFETRGRYLHTSPEFAMKKLLAAGEEKIFSLGKVYRAGETGPLHAPEFTMLEWYRANESYERTMHDCGEIARVAAEAVGGGEWRRGEQTIDATRVYDRWSCQSAFKYFAHIDLAETMDAGGAANRDALATQIARNFANGLSTVRAEDNDTWSDLFSKVIVTDVEPKLEWAVLDRYPAPEAALARRCDDDKRFAERFELFGFGVELANGFGELTDPVEQRARLVEAMDEKQKRYRERWPIDEDFLAALAHMPPSSGVALGLDRLVMLATGARSVADVLWTPPP